MREKIAVVTLSFLLTASAFAGIFTVGWYFGQQSVDIPMCPVEDVRWT